MMTLNTIFSNEDYMKQGFTSKEVPLIREHDELYNKYVIEGLTQEENDRLSYLVKVLGI